MKTIKTEVMSKKEYRDIPEKHKPADFIGGINPHEICFTFVKYYIVMKISIIKAMN